MASIEDFVQSPSEDLLNSYKKDQLLKVADHYGVKLLKKSNKDEVLATLKAHLVEEKVLSVLAVGANAPVEMNGFADVASPR